MRLGWAVTIKLIFQNQIRLSPYDPSKELNILTDGANSKGIGFVFYQNTNDNKPGDDVTIVQANSSGLKDSQLGNEKNKRSGAFHSK